MLVYPQGKLFLNLTQTKCWKLGDDSPNKTPLDCHIAPPPAWCTSRWWRRQQTATGSKGVNPLFWTQIYQVGSISHYMPIDMVGYK